MNTHKLVEIKLLKPIPGHRIGIVIKRRQKHAANLVEKNIAEYVKQEKTSIETKEEKFAPAETKVMSSTDINKVQDYSDVSVRELSGMIGDLSEDDLLNIVKNDIRVTARKIAEEEIGKRG